MTVRLPEVPYCPSGFPRCLIVRQAAIELHYDRQAAIERHYDRQASRGDTSGPSGFPW